MFHASPTFMIADNEYQPGYDLQNYHLIVDMETQSGTSFTRKLFEILDKNDNASTLRWSLDGKSFEIIDPKRLEMEILPKYFRHSRFQSLVRQLNFYNFKKISKERNSWVYQHEYFQAGRPELLELLRRKTNTSAVMSPSAAALTASLAAAKSSAALAASSSNRREAQSFKPLWPYAQNTVVAYNASAGHHSDYSYAAMGSENTSAPAASSHLQPLSNSHATWMPATSGSISTGDFSLSDHPPKKFIDDDVSFERLRSLSQESVHRRPLVGNFNDSVAHLSESSKKGIKTSSFASNESEISKAKSKLKSKLREKTKGNSKSRADFTGDFSFPPVLFDHCASFGVTDSSVGTAGTSAFSHCRDSGYADVRGSCDNGNRIGCYSDSNSGSDSDGYDSTVSFLSELSEADKVDLHSWQTAVQFFCAPPGASCRSLLLLQQAAQQQPQQQPALLLPSAAATSASAEAFSAASASFRSKRFAAINAKVKLSPDSASANDCSDDGSTDGACNSTSSTNSSAISAIAAVANDSKQTDKSSPSVDRDQSQPQLPAVADADDIRRGFQYNYLRYLLSDVTANINVSANSSVDVDVGVDVDSELSMRRREVSLVLLVFLLTTDPWLVCPTPLLAPSQWPTNTLDLSVELLLRDPALMAEMRSYESAFAPDALSSQPLLSASKVQRDNDVLKMTPNHNITTSTASTPFTAITSTTAATSPVTVIVTGNSCSTVTAGVVSQRASSRIAQKSSIATPINTTSTFPAIANAIAAATPVVDISTMTGSGSDPSRKRLSRTETEVAPSAKKQRLALAAEPSKGLALPAMRSFILFSLSLMQDIAASLETFVGSQNQSIINRNFNCNLCERSTTTINMTANSDCGSNTSCAYTCSDNDSSTSSTSSASSASSSSSSSSSSGDSDCGALAVLSTSLGVQLHSELLRLQDALSKCMDMWWRFTQMYS